MEKEEVMVIYEWHDLVCENPRNDMILFVKIQGIKQTKKPY